MQTNIDRFNLYAAHILAYFYSRFPIATGISEPEVVKALADAVEIVPDEQDTDRNSFVAHTIGWLTNTGYLMVHGDGHRRYVLSPKALEALSVRMPVLVKPEASPKEISVGDRLVEVSQDIGKEAAKKTIADVASQLVGQVIGHAIKAVTTP